jgi:hypothetical protein
MENNNQKDISPRIQIQEDGIVVVEFWGIQRVENAKKFSEEMLKLMESNKEDLNILIDGTVSLKAANIETRRLYLDFARNAKAKKVAIIGLNALKRVIASFILARIKKEELKSVKEIKIFSTKEEALKWLKEK